FFSSRRRHTRSDRDWSSDVCSSDLRGEVDQVAAKHGDDSLEAKIMRVIALCVDVPGLKLNSRNLAVVLHPSMSSDPIEPAVAEADRKSTRLNSSHDQSSYAVLCLKK